MSSFSRLFSKRPAAPRKERRPFARRLSLYETRSFRGNSEPLPPPDLFAEYKPPSVFVEHRGIVIVFAILCVALTIYWIKSVRAAKVAPEPVHSVYIEMVPGIASQPK